MFEKTISEQTVKFKSTPKKDEFAKELRKNINRYFEENNISRHANGEMWFKMAFSVVAWISVYSLIMSDILSPYPYLLIPAFSLLGFTSVFIAFAIVHDAVHNAISSKRWVNRFYARFFDFVGGNSYLLRQMHGEHHKWVNIHGIDVTLETHGLFRFTPHEPWKPIHRYQSYYIPILYALGQLHWVMFKDFKWFIGEAHIGNRKDIKHPFIEYVVLIVSKIVFYTVTLVLPMIYLSVSWWFVLICWMSIHLLSGFAFVVVFQCTHIYNGTTYPMPDGEGNIENNYALHVLNTTADFSRKSRIGSWLMGGINIHVVHHMFPNICHVHYPALTEILIKTANEFGIEYQENVKFKEAWKAHWDMIAHLSKPDSTVLEYNKGNDLSVAAA